MSTSIPAGKTRTYKAVSKTTQLLAIAGQEIKTESRESSTRSSKVGQKRDDSSHTIEQKTESVHLEMSLPMDITVNFDTSDPNAKINNPALAFLEEVAKLNAEITYTVLLDNRNKVKAIEGTEKLLEKAGKLSDQAKNAVRRPP